MQKNQATHIIVSSVARMPEKIRICRPQFCRWWLRVFHCQIREGAEILGSSNRTILLYTSRNCRPACVLWYVTFPGTPSIWIRSFELIKLKYSPDCRELMLQLDMIFVLPAGSRNFRRISAMISNLLRFLSEDVFISFISMLLPLKQKQAISEANSIART